jgi:hypothetical protein
MRKKSFFLQSKFNKFFYKKILLKHLFCECFTVIFSQNLTTKILSITGQVVFIKEKKNDTDYFNETIDVTDLSNRIYFFSVQIETTVIIKKVVIHH